MQLGISERIAQGFSTMTQGVLPGSHHQIVSYLAERDNFAVLEDVVASRFDSYRNQNVLTGDRETPTEAVHAMAPAVFDRIDSYFGLSGDRRPKLYTKSDLEQMSVLESLVAMAPNAKVTLGGLGLLALAAPTVGSFVIPVSMFAGGLLLRSEVFKESLRRNALGMLSWDTMVVKETQHPRDVELSLAHEYGHFIHGTNIWGCQRSIAEGLAMAMERRYASDAAHGSNEMWRAYLGENINRYFLAYHAACLERKQAPRDEFLQMMKPHIGARIDDDNDQWSYALGSALFSVAEMQHGFAVHDKARRGDYSLLGF